MSIGRTRYITLPPNSSPEIRRVVRQMNERNREFDRRKPIATPTTVNDNQLRPAAEMNKGRQIFVAGTTNQTQMSDGSVWQPFLSSAGSFAVPAIVLGLTAAGGSATTVIRSDATIAAFDGTVPSADAATAATGSVAFAARRDHVHLFPTSLRSTANSSTLALTDDGTDQTLTGSLGLLNLRPSSTILSLPNWTGGAAIAGAVGQVLSFNARSSVIGTSLFQGISAQITFDDASTYTSQTHVAGRFVTRTSSPATYSGETAQGVQIVLNQEAAPAAASTFTARTGVDIAVNPVLGASTTSTDHYGIKIAMQGAIGTHGTNTNARGILVDVPAFGTTIRRGIHVQTTTASRGTASANTEGVYVEDITIGTAQRANFYAEGATTGTPTDVYGLFQGTAHVVGTNRYGARFTGATTGTPTLCVGVQVDAHAVGTTKYSFVGADPSQLNGVVMSDPSDIALGATTGTKIGTATTQKLGFWNAAPVVQQTVTGSRGGNAALASLLIALATEGVIVDSSIA